MEKSSLDSIVADAEKKWKDLDKQVRMFISASNGSGETREI